MTKDDLIEKYHDINVEHEGWWDCAYDSFCTKMMRRGIVIDEDDIEFSLAHCQSDYARFKCVIDGPNLETFLQHHGLDKEYPIFATAYEYDCDVTIYFSFSGRYGVETEIQRMHDFESYVGMDVEDEDTRMAILRGLDEQWDLVIHTSEPGSPSVEEEVHEILKGYCDDLYHAMDAEYWDLVSEESIWDSIVANGLDEELEEEEDAA